MPDSQAPHGDMPNPWRDAFAALPLETPPADGWARLSRQWSQAAPGRSQIPARLIGLKWNASRRRPALYAAAAVLAIAAALPLAWMANTPPVTSPADETGTASSANVAATAASQPAVPAVMPRVDSATAPQPVATLPTQPDATAIDARREPIALGTIAAAGTATPSSSEPEPVESSAVDALAANPTPASIPAAADPVPATVPTDIAFDALYAQSAQLESLIAVARDGRVASATGTMLAGDLERRIGSIDAALSQPALTDAQRADLWRERIAALRELAGVETTQRWLAARGERYEGALVRVD